MPSVPDKVAAKLDTAIAEHRRNGNFLSRYGLCSAEGKVYYQQNTVCVASLTLPETREAVKKHPGSFLYYVTDGATPKDDWWFSFLVSKDTPWQGIHPFLDNRCLDPSWTRQNAMVLCNVNDIHPRLFYNFVIAVRYYKEHAVNYSRALKYSKQGIEPRIAVWLSLGSTENNEVYSLENNPQANHSFMCNYSLREYAKRFISSTPEYGKETYAETWQSNCEAIFHGDPVPPFAGSLHELVSHLEKHR